MIYHKMRSILANQSGQSTVEFALLMFAFLGMLLGLGVLWQALHDGVLLHRATQAASHTMTNLFDGALDVLLY